MNASSLALLPLAALCATALLPAQIVTFGGNSDRKNSSIFFFDRGANKFVGGLEITYGSPAWKDSHEKVVSSAEDGSMRLGSNGWATLDASVPLTIGGVDIAAGQWYLGLARKDGKFHLMVMDAKTLRARKVPAWETQGLRAKINAPLTHAKVETKADNLTITIAPGEKVKSKGSFTLHWGNHKLTAPLVAHLGSKPTSKKSDGE